MYLERKNNRTSRDDPREIMPKCIVTVRQYKLLLQDPLSILCVWCVCVCVCVCVCARVHACVRERLCVVAYKTSFIVVPCTQVA